MGGRRGSRPVWPLLALSLLAAAPLCIAAAACGGSGNGPAGGGTVATPKQGGTYDYPLAVDPGSFDPSIAQTLDGCAVLQQLYEGLVRWEEQPDGTMKTAPGLAESWRANADATVWTFRLRRGVMFQAPVSREVTAADVVADLRYRTDPAHNDQMAYMFIPIKGVGQDGYARAGPLGVTALDRYTVRFTLNYPFSEFDGTLGSQAFWVWPVDHLRKMGRKAYAQHPVGTGPYRFQREVAGTSIDLVRNPDWWDTSGGPYIGTIHYEVFSSVTAMMLAFQKGMIDWTTLPFGQVAASRSLPQVKSGRWKVESTPNLALRYLCINMRDPVVGGTQGLRLRQALAYGCDRRGIIDASSGGVFVLPTTGVVPPGVPGAHDVRDPYAYDPAKAQQLMRAVGPITLTLAYPIGQQQEGTVLSLTASYAKIGITIKAKGIAFSRYIDFLSAGKGQLYLFGWLADYPSMDDFLYPLFESSQSPYVHYTRYSNPRVDALLAQARATLGEQARLELYAQAERLILADAPEIPLIVFGDVRLVNGRVADVRFNSMSWVDMWRAWVK